jgi:hypothetical protein
MAKVQTLRKPLGSRMMASTSSKYDLETLVDQFVFAFGLIEGRRGPTIVDEHGECRNMEGPLFSWKFPDPKEM